jgi:hypothetical protein
MTSVEKLGGAICEQGVSIFGRFFTRKNVIGL